MTITATQTELRAWLGEAWDPQLSLAEWRERLVDSGWACPMWPRAWHGRELDAATAADVADALVAAGAVGAPPGFGFLVAAPTLLDCASATLKRRHLRPIATGTHKWCELFSEPGSGSDLAGLTTRATPRGGSWAVSGHKAWATGAHLASFALLLTRTDWDVPKHEGLTMFVLPLDRPGVQVRPVALMNGATTHEVLLDEVVLDRDDVVSEPGQGWKVAQTTLAHERRLAAMHRAPALTTGAGRAVREAHAEYEQFASVYSWMPDARGRPDLLPARLGDADAETRQRIAAAAIDARVATIAAGRISAARGVSPSVVKLAGSHAARRAAAAHRATRGASGLLADDDVAAIDLSVHAASLIGGTDEIQRNVIAERVLGLPRERAADAGVPFRDVPTNDRRPTDGTPAVPHP